MALGEVMTNVKKALVVDDNQALLSMMELLLEGHGYQVQLHDSPIPAVFQAGSERYDLLITDVWMPQIKGGELVERIRATRLNTHVPVVFISGHPDSELESLKEISNAFFLRKPFKSDALIEVLERIGAQAA